MTKFSKTVMALCLGLSVLRSFAQQPAGIEEGAKPFGSYAGSNVESVNTENGKLLLNIPLYSAPQRGQLAVSVSLAYKNIAYETVPLCEPPTTDCDSQVEPVPGAAPAGVTASIDQDYYVSATNTAESQGNGSTLAYIAYDVRGTDGSAHNLAYDGSVYRAVDGSGFMYTPAASSTPPWEAGPSSLTSYPPGILTDQKGTQYTLSPVTGSTDGQLTAITDADGNYLSVTGSGPSLVVTDSMNRTVMAPPTQPTTSSVMGCPTINAPNQTLSGSAPWSVPGYGGSQPFLFCFATVPISTGQDDPAAKLLQYHVSPYFIQSIVLPDKTWWGFVYDAANPNDTSSIGYGDLVQLIYPTSGTVSYTWGFDEANPWFCELTGPPLPGPRAIMTRIVNSNQVSGNWQYAFTIENQGTTGLPQTTITDPSGDQIVYTFQDLSAGSVCNLYERSRAYNQKTSNGSLVPVKTVSTQYQVISNYDGRGYAVAYPKTIITQYAGGESYQTMLTMDQGVSDSWYQCIWNSGDVSCSQEGPIQVPLGKQTKEVDYDFSGSPLKETDTSYWWQSNPSYLTANMLATPSQVTVLDNGVQQAQTTYTYDEASKVRLTPLQPVTVQIGAPPNSIYGHVTTTQQWLNSGTGPSSSTFWLNTGEVDHTTDPKGNSTAFTYSPTYDGAFPTMVTNALGQSTTIGYDFNSGLVANVIDPNQQTTSYTYDGLNRVMTINYPDEGQTTNLYNPSGYPQNTVLTTKLMCNGSASCLKAETNGQSIQTLSLYDGLGRISESEVLTDPAGSDVVITTYDALGRVQAMTNPYRTTSDPTYGTTQYAYDMLDRLLIETEPDASSTRQWCYDGQAVLNGQNNCLANAVTGSSETWVDYSDESLNHWQQTYDALGRLVGVMEPNSSGVPSLQTTYTYNALNLTVTQNGVSGETPESRSFVYDSLSRLTSATNVENGTTTYTYDANGNVMSRVDARGNSAGGTWFCYDAMNRVTEKAYSQQTCPFASPSAQYGYDSSSISGSSNTIGRLTSETTTLNGNLWTQRQPYSYDPLGRLLSEQQCNLIAGCGASGYTLSYSYDLIGNEISSTALVGSQNAVLTYHFDPASHLSGITSTLADSLHPSPLFSATATSASAPAYWASGQLANAQIALNYQTQQAAMSLSRTPDIRLRPISETDSGLAGTPGTPASATVTISGSEQSIGGSGSATPATGTISLTYSDAQVIGAKPLYVGNSITLPDGYHASFVATANSAIVVANALAAVLNSASSPVTAVVGSGGTASAASVTLTSKATGADENGPITLSLSTTQVKAAPATMSGGGGTTYDTGTVTANVGGIAVSTSYGQASTPQALAAALASGISGAGAGVTATADASGDIIVTYNQVGTAGNGITVTLSSATNQPKFFSSPSFTGTSGTLGGGTDGSSSPATIYQYTIPAPSSTTGYAANGNLLSYSGCVLADETCAPEAWSMSYDHLNRLLTATATAGPWNSVAVGWAYDSFGNRKTQTVTVNGSPQAPLPSDQALLPVNNQITASGYAYDAAGNLTQDPSNEYAYDSEGRLCAVYNNTLTEATGYIYDAESRRVGKYSFQSQVPFSCNYSTPTQSTSYLLGQSGEQISELDGTGNFQRSHVYANGELLATYNSSTTEFVFHDWLGTKRVVAGPTGAAIGTCSSLPFGDELSCTNISLSGHHFTGQIHDQESLNDYFGARYYSEYTGRFMSPDPGGLSVANPANPQSWNMYSYALNNPLTNTDPTGLDCVYFNDAGNGVESVDQNSNSGECGSNGGDWINGTLNSWQYNRGSDTFSFQSSSSFYNYNTTASAPGSQTNGIPCYGNCDTPTGYTGTLGVLSGSWWGGLVHSPWVVGWILPVWPLPPAAGVGPAGSVAWNPATKTLCGSLGAGASVGDNLAAGPVTGRTLNGQQASPSELDQIFGGWSLNFGFNAPTGSAPVGPGVQASANGSGVAYGPTVGIAGASVSATYALCGSL